jgi:threonine synthase
MKNMTENKLPLEASIDREHSPESSIVLRYLDAFNFGMTDEESAQYKEWLRKTSIQEGARIFPLLSYKGVDIHILDETTLMRTRTLKSIDGCVTTARCKLMGEETVVFESGGNTGSALTAYGQRAGLETYFFVPEANLSLLNSKLFEPDRAHLISVKERDLVKEATHAFASATGYRKIPEVAWRYEASRFRGCFILEHMIENGPFDWLAQTISAAFGPIGIYNVLERFGGVQGRIPRFLGIQQEGNCPMYRAWKSKGTMSASVDISPDKDLLAKVMYDVKPHTHGTYEDLRTVLIGTQGDIESINRHEFSKAMGLRFDSKSILDLLENNGLEITMHDGDVTEKAGLIALAGTLKGIDDGTIPAGSKVLSSLTGGASLADNRARPDHRICRLKDINGLL